MTTGLNDSGQATPETLHEPGRNYVVSVVVTYFPEKEVFTTLLTSLLAQTDFVIITDNTPTASNEILDSIVDESSTPEHCRLLKFNKNLGIAEAINIGCQEAMDIGANLILLSDQDSHPADDMVDNLVHVYNSEYDSGENIGAIGPIYSDLHTGLTYPFQTKITDKFFYGHKIPTASEPIVEALTLITSGTLIPVDTLKQVGPMRVDLFIDQVDIEWSHRARSKGYKLFGSGNATMFHRMGENSLRVWYLGWRNESSYSPLRLYYRTRNYVALCKLDYIDWRWKLRSGWYTLGLVYSHVFFSEKSLASLKMSAKGVLHGILGRMGESTGDD